MLTAGTVGSAQLLMLSGIGPQAHLREVGVEVVLDLPGVGANVHDHPAPTVVYSSPVPIPAGPNNHAEIVGLLRSDLALDAPDLQFGAGDPDFAPAMPPALPGARTGLHHRLGSMIPRSRGSVRLSGARPDAAPLLDPNYYGDDRDLEDMAAGLRLARAIGRAERSGSVAGRGGAAGPGGTWTTTPACARYVRRAWRSYSHPVGICRIGKDDMASSTPSCGCTASTGCGWPTPPSCPPSPSANTNATVYGIAERAADLVKAR